MGRGPRALAAPLPGRGPGRGRRPRPRGHPDRDDRDHARPARSPRGDGDHEARRCERSGHPASPAPAGHGAGPAGRRGCAGAARGGLCRRCAQARAAAPADPGPRPRGVPLAAADPAPDRRRRLPGRAWWPPGPRARDGLMVPAARSALPLLLLVFVLAVPAAGQQKKDSGDLNDKERALQQTQKRLKEERAKAAEARKREAGILSDLEAIDRRLNDKRKQVALLDGRIRRTQAEMSDLQQDIARLESRRAGQEDAMAQRLRAMYRLQVQGGALPVLLSGDDPVAQAVRLRHLTTLATVDARMIQEYRVTSEGLADRKNRLEARRGEMSVLRTEAEGERADADREAAKRRVILARVRDERAYHDRMVGELGEATRRLEAFIRDLQEKRRVAKVPPPSSKPPKAAPGESTPGVGLGTMRGRLEWPAAGRVVEEYGTRVNPRFGTKTFRNGIDIDAVEGSNVHAVYPGHVLYTGWFRGYGNLIIVDHGSEYYTLYAHVADMKVAEGDDVRQGQVIGTVGDTGSLQGPRLYFEVRYQGRPQDPAQWLRPRG